MAAGCFRFADFAFDPGERMLTRGSERIDLNSRYLDALGLLLRQRGKLVTKTDFMDEVWRGIPVTDEALTQCIRTLRRQLGDNAANPQFIETVPKHGYRFVGDAYWSSPQAGAASGPTVDVKAITRTATWGGIGGALAGAGGGLFYGLLASSPVPTGGIGAISMLLVMLMLSVPLGFLAGLGVGAGIGASSFMEGNRWHWPAAGGLLGGLAIGGIAKLIGMDAFDMLFGRAPDGMTGPAEGALLGAAIGLAAWFAASRRSSPAASAIIGGAVTACAGLLAPLLGGHLLGGSLGLLTRAFPASRFSLDRIGALVGDDGFGRLAEALTATLEGGLFGACVVGMLAVQRRSDRMSR